MGNRSIKSSNKKLTAATKRRHSCCCCCCLNSSDSVSSCSTDEKYYPTFDRLRSNAGHALPTANKQIIYCQSVEDLQKAWQGAVSTDQWIDSLPILGTTPVHQRKSNQSEGPRVENGTHGEPQAERVYALQANRDLLNFAKKCQLNVYVNDYLHRLQSSHVKQTFKSHFSSSKIIYPSNGADQALVEDLTLLVTHPPESILPRVSTSTASSCRILEQTRARCYFIPFSTCQVEPDDDEYKQRCRPLDRTHVVITLVNNPTTKTDITPSPEWNPPFTFVSNDSFQTGWIRLNPSRINKEVLPFVHECPERSGSYLSSDLIQQWLNTLVLVNQTCAVAKRFLIGDGSHITCLFKRPINTESAHPSRHNLIFASFRLPSCARLADSFSSEHQGEKLNKIIDAFAPVCPPISRKLPTDTIQIDYEHYSVGILLSRWPKNLLDSYCAHPLRAVNRRWPSSSQMDVLTKKPLLLIPTGHAHSWEISFEAIEDHLFGLMGESTLYFYTLCQQLLAPTYNIRRLIKHGFLNYCEKHGLPYSDPRQHLPNLLTDFLRELSEQIHRRCLPNHFDQQVNLLDAEEDYHTPWFDHITRCAADRTYLTVSSVVAPPSNRPMIVEFFFHFIDRLHRTFRHNRSEFHLNDAILLDLHRQACKDLLTDDQYTFFDNEQTMENIRMNLAHEFETNAELVHTCLNQIRKAQSSLIFHYTWTIYVQYLHTYYNVLWNMENFDLIR